MEPKKNIKKHKLIEFDTLGSGQTFSGDWIDVSEYTTISLDGDTNSVIEFSQDGVNVHRSMVLPRDSYTTHHINIIDRYFRPRYNNNRITFHNGTSSHQLYGT
jgi:hypothetical protein